jgi:hypothetical protein
LIDLRFPKKIIIFWNIPFFVAGTAKEKTVFARNETPGTMIDEDAVGLGVRIVIVIIPIETDAVPDHLKTDDVLVTTENARDLPKSSRLCFPRS